MVAESWRRRRVEFDHHPDSYVRARPPYPDRLVADLGRLAGLGEGRRILEIGCGPGTLTRSLAKFGSEIFALELGEHMAAAARVLTSEFPRVKIINTAFEDWSPPGELFDLVVAGASFHWLDPAVRVPKMLDALKPRGFVAVANKHRVRGSNAQLEADIQACYVRWDPSAAADYQHPVAPDVVAEVPEFLSEPRLGGHQIRRYAEEISYTSSGYRDLLNTYPDFTSRTQSERDGLAGCLCSLIDSKYDGVLVMPLLCTLHVARLVTG